MNLIDAQRRVIEGVINAFETSSAEGDYAKIAIFADGPNDIRQITYGRSQTTEYGNLRRLVKAYVDAGGTFSQDLAPYADLVGSTPLTDNVEFKRLLRKAGREDPVMRQTQDRFFEDVYFKPAMRWADQHGLTLPLSALVIYDSFIHSGSILWLIRNMFPENPPSAGGDEKAWVSAYVKARHRWLSTHHRAVVRATVYRTKCLKKEIQRGNWDLSVVPVNANGVQVS